MHLFGKKEDRVVIVSRAEWEDWKADVRGLKRLADLESQARAEQNKRFADAIDTLEKRVADVSAMLAAFADASGRNATEFSGRLDRLAAGLADATEDIAQLRNAARSQTEITGSVALGRQEEFAHAAE